MTHRQRIQNRILAISALQVYKETGKLNYFLAYKKANPGVSDQMARYQAQKEFNKPEMVLEVAKIFNLTSDQVKKQVDPDGILKKLCEDIEQIDFLVKSGKLGISELASIMNCKREHLKLIGAFLGIWKADKPQEAMKSLQDQYRDLFGLPKGETNDLGRLN